MSKDRDADHDEMIQALIDGDPRWGPVADQPRAQRKRFAAALQRDRESAQEAGMLGYQARLLVQCSMPYRCPADNEWIRRNGGVSLTLWAPREIGLPYGAIPRLLLTWVTTEAVRTQKRRLEIRDSLTRFMADLGITGSPNGREIRRFKGQIRRLFSTTITSSLTDRRREMTDDIGMRLAARVQLWWNPGDAASEVSRITLTEEFFRLITDRPVPVDLRAVKVLKGSALALDIYSWLVYRLSYLKKPTTIPWELLQGQFGGDYANTKQGRYDFKRSFAAQLHAVLQLYPTAKAEADSQGVTLRPSRLHIDR